MKYPNVPTSKDVALLAGVSQATVSRAFTSIANLAPDTMRRVMEAANALNYRPNALARSLVSTHSNIIGVVKGHTRNVMFSEMLSEIVYGLQRADKRVIYFESEENDSIDSLTDKILQYQIEGLILMYVNLTSELTESCRRQLGFLKRLKQYGFGAPIVRHGLYTYEFGQQAMRELAPALSLPCAILCGNDMIGCGAIDVLKYEYKLEIGRDVALIGFDNIFMGSLPPYSLSTFTQPITEMAQDGLSLLFANIEDHKMAPVTHRYPLSLIERESTKKK